MSLVLLPLIDSRERLMSNVVFQAELTVLPPSVNEMYVYTSRGPRPSGKMKKFKARASIEIAKQVDFAGSPLDENSPYLLKIDYFLPALFNKGFPKKAKTRYKRRDVSNLVKVLEDVLANCLGIDDSCFTEQHVRKLHGPDHDFVGIRLEVSEAPQPTEDLT
jgi:Holliday junction resolvase RusA-like endonuclease